MHTLSGKHNLPFLFLPLLNGVNSLKKEFAPIGANSFIQEQAQLWNSLFVKGNNKNPERWFSFAKNVGKYKHVLVFTVSGISGSFFLI